MNEHPLRLLLVDHAPIVGGVEIMIRDLLTALDLAQVAAMVITDVNSPIRGRFSARVPEILLLSSAASCILRLHFDPALRAELIAKGQARVLARYTQKHIAEQTYAFYQKLLVYSTNPASS